MATKKVKPMLTCVGVNSPMLDCCGVKNEDEFYTSWSKFEGDKMIYCKSCCEKIFKYYLKETEDEKNALYLTCSVLKIPFRKEIYENLKIVTIAKYVQSLRLRTNQKEIWKDFDATNVDLTEVDTKLKEIQLKEKELEELKYRWGEQDSIDDYNFLERTYNKYTKDIDELSVQQQDLYQDLCRDRLLLRKLSENGLKDNDMITKVQSRVQGLMKTLKLDNFEGNQKKTLSEQSFIEKIKLIEKTEPLEVMAEINKNKYVDYNKRKQYYTDLVLRPLCNTLAGHKDFNIDMSDLDKYNLEGDKL